MNACVYVCVFVCVYLTERPYEFSLHGPRECIDETGRCESNKQNVVQEHNVEAQTSSIESVNILILCLKYDKNKAHVLIYVLY